MTWTFQDLCGRIAHEWPAYTIADVANLPYTHYRALRTLFLRVQHAKQAALTEHSGPEGRSDVRVIDMDERLGIKDA